MNMANNAAMRQALIWIGFMQDAAQAVIENQGIDSLEETALSKEEEISENKLCRHWQMTTCQQSI